MLLPTVLRERRKVKGSGSPRWERIAATVVISLLLVWALEKILF